MVNFITHGISKNSRSSDADEQRTDSEKQESEAHQQSNPLTEFATNLNEQAESGKIDPLIGRIKEVNRVVQILSRRRKNNPLLVGDSGVGKTAVAEGLARLIVRVIPGDSFKKYNIFT